MSVKTSFDTEDILNRWARGESYEQIAAAIGVLRNDRIYETLNVARAIGDPRAARRPGRRTFQINRDNYLQAARTIRHRKTLAKFPASPAELATAIQSYTGPITQCSPGFHAGHRPKCLDYFSI